MTRGLTALHLAILVTVTLGAFQLAEPFFRDTYDGETHLFFADHYLRGWFDPWEERWEGGFFVFSYPPLVHQLIALFGHAVGLENGYRIVQGIGLIAYPLAVRLFTRELTTEDIATQAAFLSVFVAGVYMFLYTFGQLPSFVGVVLTLLAAAYLVRYLRSGSTLTLASWTTFVAAAAAAHHHNVLFALPLLGSAIVISSLWAARGSGTPVLRRAIIAGSTAVLAVGVVLIPFWWWFFTQRLPLAPIPYLGRDNPFASLMSTEMFFVGIYGGLLAIVPFNPWRHLMGSLWPFRACIVLFATLGLGMLTPLPRFVFGGWSDLLIYDGFALWAAILFTVPATMHLNMLAGRGGWRRYVLAAVVALLIVAAGRSATFGRSNNLFSHVAPWEEEEIVRFLSDGNHADWYYITLGLREPDAVRIGRRAPARTIDGYYYVARRRDELRESGSPMLDVALWAGPEAMSFLESILREPGMWGLKWAVVARSEYSEVLGRSGWVPLHPLGSDADYEPGAPIQSTIWIWQVPDSISVPSLGAANWTPAPEVPRFMSSLWGVLPLGVLGLGCLFSTAVATGGRRGRRTMPGDGNPGVSARG